MSSDNADSSLSQAYIRHEDNMTVDTDNSVPAIAARISSSAVNTTNVRQTGDRFSFLVDVISKRAYPDYKSWGGFLLYLIQFGIVFTFLLIAAFNTISTVEDLAAGGFEWDVSKAGPVNYTGLHTSVYSNFTPGVPIGVFAYEFKSFMTADVAHYIRSQPSCGSSSGGLALRGVKLLCPYQGDPTYIFVISLCFLYFGLFLLYRIYATALPYRPDDLRFFLNFDRANQSTCNKIFVFGGIAATVALSIFVVFIFPSYNKMNILKFFAVNTLLFVGFMNSEYSYEHIDFEADFQREIYVNFNYYSWKSAWGLYLNIPGALRELEKNTLHMLLTGDDRYLAASCITPSALEKMKEGVSMDGYGEEVELGVRRLKRAVIKLHNLEIAHLSRRETNRADEEEQGSILREIERKSTEAP